MSGSAQCPAAPNVRQRPMSGSAQCPAAPNVRQRPMSGSAAGKGNCVPRKTWEPRVRAAAMPAAAQTRGSHTRFKQLPKSPPTIPCSPPPIPYSLLTTTYSLLPTTYSLLPTTYSLLPTTYSLLPTTYPHSRLLRSTQGSVSPFRYLSRKMMIRPSAAERLVMRSMPRSFTRSNDSRNTRSLTSGAVKRS